MSENLRFFRLWSVLGLLACAVLAYECLIPNPPQPLEFSQVDKLEHALAYCILGAWFGAILPTRHLRVLVALAVFGGVIEILQSFTGYRSGDALDLAADIVGAIIGLGIARLCLTRALRWLDGYLYKHVFATRNRT